MISVGFGGSLDFSQFLSNNLGDFIISSILLYLFNQWIKRDRADDERSMAQTRLTEKVVEGREAQVEALKDNTAAQRESTAANLAAHKITQDTLANIQTRAQGIEDTQATMNEAFRNFLADFSRFETSVSSTIQEFKEKVKADAKEFAG